MNYLDKIRQIITEGYNFTNPNEVMQAIKTNQVGAKIDPSYKQLNGNTEGNVRLNLLKYFKKCTELGIKDTTYGIQILLSKTNDINLEQAVKNDGLYEFLKSYRKPWVKQLSEYQQFMNNKFNSAIWTALEKAIQNEQANHGNAKKGSGALQDVKTLYDDGVWKLLVPSSFEGEKAAAYFIEDGKETPTHWCTRVDKRYYEHYTSAGPLYIIRNMKTGDSYQMAFMKGGSVEFLDQYDENGDEITNGDLTKIPDNLLKLIKDPRKENGDTLLDYKKGFNLKKLPKKRGYISGNVSNGSPTSAIFGKPVDLGNGVMKKEILNYSDENYSKANALKQWFKMTGYEEYDRTSKPININNFYVKKRKATAYYLKDKPDSTWVYLTSANRDGKPILDGTILQRNFEDLSKQEQEKIEKAANDDFGYTKNEQRHNDKRYKENEAADKYIDKYEMTDELVNKICVAINQKIDFSNSKIFSGLYYFNTPKINSSFGNNKTLIKEIYFMPKPNFFQLNNIKRKDPIDVIFKTGISDDDKPVSFNKDGVFDKSLIADNYNNATYLTANCAIFMVDYNAYLLPEEEFKFVKSVAHEIQKQIIKDKDYINLNMERKIKAQKRGEQPRLYESANYFPY